MNAKFGIAAKMVALAFTLVAVAATGARLFSYYGFRQEMINQNVKLLREEINIEAEVKKKEFEELIKDTRFLSNTPPVQGIVRAINNNGIDPYDRFTKEAWIERLAHIFEEFLKAKHDYIKLDLILFSEAGDELVSSKKVDGKIFFEDKTNRKEEWPSLMNVGNKLLAGQVSLSKIGLMQENGQVIEPHIPVIKAVKPLYENDAGRLAS